MPVVSIIIPVYNTQDYLKECLDSVINQTLEDIEIICVNDGSTDNCLNILKEYSNLDSRIKVINQGNKGAGYCRNKGMENAKGEYLYFLDSDDFIAQDLLEKLYNRITTMEADICICKHNFFDESIMQTIPNEFSLKTELLPDKDCFSVDDIPDRILQICIPNLFIKLYKREFILKNNLKFQEIKTCNDDFFDHLSLILADSITCVNEFLASYRIHHGSCLTAQRGRTAYCALIAFNSLKEALYKEKLFKKVKESFYRKAMSAFIHETQFCTDEENFKVIKDFIRFLPKKDRKEFQKLAGIKYRTYLFGLITYMKKQNTKIYKIFNFTLKKIKHS